MTKIKISHGYARTSLEQDALRLTEIFLFKSISCLATSYQDQRFYISRRIDMIRKIKQRLEQDSAINAGYVFLASANFVSHPLFLTIGRYLRRSSMNSKNTRLICVHVETYSALKKLGCVTETFDEVIKRLLVNATEMEKLVQVDNR